MEIKIPELSLVILMGASGAGKTTFAKKHFKGTEVLSSDFCRGLVCDHENSQEATDDAFEVLHFIAGRRLSNRRITVIDATNVQREARKPLLALADTYHVLPVAIVLNLPEAVCREQSGRNPNRNLNPLVIEKQCRDLQRSLKQLKREGFKHIFILSSPEEVEQVTVERVPLWNNLRQESGPFDIIGDVHGCFDELSMLLNRLGYEIEAEQDSEGDRRFHVMPTQGIKAIFLGDLVDRGPDTPNVLRLVMSMVESGVAFCVPGNHDVRLVRALRGKKITISHGLAESLRQLEQEPQSFKDRVISFLDSLVSHYVLDGGRLVVAHAGMKESMQGRASRKVREFALYGETTGETDEFGLPIRHNWADEYRGQAMVVYGHTPVPMPEWLNRSINIDTGCVFGGSLTALRYPENELVSVQAARPYCRPLSPTALGRIDSNTLSAQQQHDDLLHIEDVLGRRRITTRLRSSILIQEENAFAALEVMSRFAVNPKWLIYLPPTMAPCETSSRDGFLEYPEEAFSYYRKHDVARVVCEEKHMGSRSVVIVCRDEDVARKRFGIEGEGIGICTTRTGRRFFQDRDLESQLLSRLGSVLESSGLFHELKTDWVCLDCEIMPWSLKAFELVRDQYAAVGAASRHALSHAVAALEQAHQNSSVAGIGALLDRFRSRAAMSDKFVKAYRPYCWSVQSVTDVKVAPFHLMASEGTVHLDRNHAWHMEVASRLSRVDRELFGNGFILRSTAHRIVDVTDEESRNEGIHWWEELTQAGSEGIVIKPFDFVARNSRGFVQPAIKCRGREYLRIIYGPEYTAPEHLDRLRRRTLATKRSQAMREFALGIEALERFARNEPLRRVHECVFGILALESEAVDPRL